MGMSVGVTVGSGSGVCVAVGCGVWVDVGRVAIAASVGLGVLVGVGVAPPLSVDMQAVAYTVSATNPRAISPAFHNRLSASVIVRLPSSAATG